MNTQIAVASFFWALALSGCEQSSGFEPIGDTAFAPSGIDPDGESVDGLLVGHRLMAAGEYELALRSYARAGVERGMTVDVLSAAGSANLMLGRLGQAEELLRQAIESDDRFAPAWNNLGVVLMEQREYGEASRVFQTAFALDSGESVEIRDNLRLALAKVTNPTYSDPNTNFALVRRGPGEFELLATPKAN